MFNFNTIERLFAEDKDLLAVTPDSKWVIYKFDRGEEYEIRIETNFEAVHSIFLEKDNYKKDKLIEFIKEVGLWETK